MRLSLRFILPLAIVLAAIAYAVVPLVDNLTLQWFVRDLDIRTSLISRTIQEPLAVLVREGSRAKVLRYFDRLIQDERLFAVGLCEERRLVYKTLTFPAPLGCATEPGDSEKAGWIANLARGPVHVSNNPLEADGKVYGRLVLVHDMSFVQRRSDDTKKYIFYFFAALAAIVSLMTVVIAEISWRGWVAGLRAVIRGETFGFGETKVRLPELQARSARPAGPDQRARIRAQGAGRGPDQLVGGNAAGDPAKRLEGRGSPDRFKPRALHPRAPWQGHRGPAPRERTGHRAGARDARLFRDLDRTRRRQRRPGNGGCDRPHSSSS